MNKVYLVLNLMKAGNGISRLLDSKLFWGVCPLIYLGGGAFRPLKSYGRLL